MEVSLNTMGIPFFFEMATITSPKPQVCAKFSMVALGDNTGYSRGNLNRICFGPLLVANKLLIAVWSMNLSHTSVGCWRCRRCEGWGPRRMGGHGEIASWRALQEGGSQQTDRTRR